jgi:hypothetical protein
MIPLAPCGIKAVFIVPLHSTKSDTLTEVFIVSKKVILYQTCGDTCCPGGSTPKNRSLADSSKMMIEGFTCIFSLATAQCLRLQDLGSSRRMKCLTDDDQKPKNKKLRNSTPNIV